MLTRRQAETLSAIKRLTSKDGVAPTLRELGKELGIAQSNVSHLLDRLEERGFIRRPRYRARAIEILRDGPAMSPEIKELCDAARSVIMGDAVPMPARIERLTAALSAVEGWEARG